MSRKTPEELDDEGLGKFFPAIPTTENLIEEAIKRPEVQKVLKQAEQTLKAVQAWAERN
jgi:hypothetical protein